MRTETEETTITPEKLNVAKAIKTVNTFKESTRLLIEFESEDPSQDFQGKHDDIYFSDQGEITGIAPR